MNLHMVAFEYFQFDIIFNISKYKSALHIDVDRDSEWIQSIEPFLNCLKKLYM